MLQASQVFALRFSFLPDGKAAIKCVDEHECRATLRKQCISFKTRARPSKAMEVVMDEYKHVVKLKESLRILEESTAELNLLKMEDLPHYYE